ncbi:hypothetical protein PFLUV_G00010830 [Perca fluviatilis]|uniref:Uncharacterized protein n=1 Tax=Perca fluviatilis TaxID=8168 RepID=A0A6A5FRT8_PERFL|nr:hypothetical protein PFLUV_G00010830 [Perca fluviatilis]
MEESGKVFKTATKNGGWTGMLTEGTKAPCEGFLLEQRNYIWTAHMWRLWVRTAATTGYISPPPSSS